MKLTPSIKGLITALLMIALFLLLYMTTPDGGNGLQFTVYGLYGAGIIWTLLAYRRTPAYTGGFAEVFGQGFRCFVVVTLCMALFYGLFNALHPEFAEQQATLLREQLLQEKDKLPAEVDNTIATFKKQYTLKLVSGAIFGYLIIGAFITAVLSVLLRLSPKNK